MNEILLKTSESRTVADMANEVFEKVDFSVLQEVLNEKLKKTRKEKVVLTSSIVKLDLDSEDSEASSDGVVIGLKNIFKRNIHQRIEFLVALVHELVHYVSISKYSSNDKTVNFGMSRVEINSSKSISGEGINEGVTEMLAHEIVQEYLRRTGDSQFFLQGITFGKAAEEFGMYSYGHNLEIVNALIAVLERSENMDREIIWQALQETYLNTKPLDSKEIKELLKKVLGPDVASQVTYTDAESMSDVEVKDRILSNLKSLYR